MSWKSHYLPLMLQQYILNFVLCLAYLQFISSFTSIFQFDLIKIHDSLRMRARNATPLILKIEQMGTGGSLISLCPNPRLWGYTVQNITQPSLC